MFDWLQRNSPRVGFVLFRGNLPPRAEDFFSLRKQGITLKRFPEKPERHWGLKLLHPTWGEADLLCMRGFTPPSPVVVRFDACLTDEEKQDIAGAGNGVVVRMKVSKQHVLRDRKMLLRFLRVVLGEDGLVACDTEALRFWSRSSLDDELQHDADLDIECIYSIHAVIRSEQDEACYWLHTHGLKEAGGFDVDIFNPSADLSSGSNDLLRAMAFAILEKAVSPNEQRYTVAHPGGDVRLVPVAEFRRRVDPRQLVDPDALKDENHATNRSVLCEPARGMFARWSKRVEPAKFLMKELPDGTVLQFSDAASSLMGERALATYAVFRRFAEEFAAAELPCLVKLGYPTDGGKSGGREHLWFQVHSAMESDIDATLLNQPYHVSKLKEGDRGRHSVELLTDWTILTPVGSITPRSMFPARVLRANWDKVLRAKKDSDRANGG